MRQNALLLGIRGITRMIRLKHQKKTQDDKDLEDKNEVFQF